MIETKWMQPVLETNKIAFQAWYSSVSSMQDQAEQMMDLAWNQVPVVPESNKKLLREWTNLFKKERDNLKKMMDEGLETFERLFFAQVEGKEEKAEKSKSSTTGKAAST